MPATRLPSAVPALLAAALAAGCATGTAPAADRGGTPPAVTGLGDGATPAPGAPARDGGPTPVRVVTELAFRSPSGRIVCALDAEGVGCDVQNTWRVGPTPASCDSEYGKGVWLQAGGVAELSCSGDPVAGTTDGSGPEVLPYAASVRAGSVTCTSERTGMTCRDLRTSHGFTVSRAAYRLY